MRPTVLILAASLCRAQAPTAAQLIEAGHWKRARVLVERRLSEAPEDADANFLLSQIRNAFGDRVLPSPLAEKALRLNPNVARYHRQVAEVQGVMAQHAGMFQQLMLARRFRKEIDQALRLDAHDTQAMRDLLEFYLIAPGVMGGDAAKADAVAQQIAAIDAGEGFLAKARIAEFRKDPMETEAMLRRATELRPPSYKSLMALAEHYLAPEDRKDAAAEELAKRAVRLDGGRSEAYGVLASVFAGRGDWTALDSVLQAAAREAPDDASPYYRAADRLLTENRDPARTERYLRVYLAQEPEGNQPTATDARRKLVAASARNGGAN